MEIWIHSRHDGTIEKLLPSISHSGDLWSALAMKIASDLHLWCWSMSIRRTNYEFLSLWIKRASADYDLEIILCEKRSDLAIRKSEIASLLIVSFLHLNWSDVSPYESWNSTGLFCCCWFPSLLLNYLNWNIWIILVRIQKQVHASFNL